MKLYNPQLEATVLKAVCSLDKINAGKLLSHITTDSFYDEAAVETFNYIKETTLHDGVLPSWEQVTTDPRLSETARSFLMGTEAKKVKDARSVSRLLESVNHYEKLRRIYNLANDTIEDLVKPSVDLESLTQRITEASSELHTNVIGVKEQIARIGRGNNTKGLVEDCLDGETLRVVPTGFRVFDDVNGGLPMADLMLGAGPTGGGKTAIMAIQLLLNLSMHAPAILIPLEMTKQQTMHRVLSNLSGIKINKFTSGTLTDDEKIKARKAYTRFAKEQKKRDTEYAIWDPERDITMEEALYSVLPYNYDIILIDYVGLLKGMDEDNQARALGAAARFAKVFAKTHNKLVIILAQLSDDMKVRYSRAMAEHAANAWMWQYSQAERDSGIVTILPFKSRNQDPTPFNLAVDFSVMRAGDATEADFQTKEDPTGDKVATKVKQTKDQLTQMSKDIDEYVFDDED